MTVSYTTNKSFIKTFRPGDPEFTIIDGFMTSPRAGFEISNNCPAEYKSIFITAVNAGWIKPVAHVYGKELTMDAMR